MKSSLQRALVFAITTFVVLLVADLAVWGGYQGMHPRDQLASQLVLRGYMHAGVLLLSLAGAAVAFWLLQRRLPSLKAASSFGALFAVISFFAVVIAFEAAGVVAAAAWLLVGSALVALASGLFVRPHGG